MSHIDSPAPSSISVAGVSLSDEPATIGSSDDEPPIRRSRSLRPAISPLVPIVPTNGATSAYYPILPPTLSRRSSSAGSAVSGCSSKSVHFQSADSLTSVWHTYSPDQYDRSPIIPSGEDLEIPSCKNSKEGGWIKCLRRKAKEAAAEGVAPPFISAVFNQPVLIPSQPEPSPPASPLIDGLPASAPGVPSSFVVSTADHAVPVLSPDDSSCSSECSDFEHQLPSPIQPDDEASPVKNESKHHRTASMELCLSLAFDDAKLKSSWRDELSQEAVEDDEDNGDDDGAEEHASGDEDESCSAPRQRGLGMCSLGKWSRSSLYSECDALGGF